MTGLDQTAVLIRHGEAMSESEDPSRSLSATGRRRAGRTATLLAGLALNLEELHHSDKARARQTAEIVAAGLGMGPERLRAVPGIAPNDSPEPVAIELEAERRSICLVGHLPFMCRLGSRLLAGEADRLTIRFVDAAAMVLGRNAGRWHLLAFIDPDLGQ